MLQPSIRDRLSLGRAIPGGGIVTDADWEAFEAEVVAPRFPQGYTIQRVEGVWRDERTGQPIREPTIVLDIARPDTIHDHLEVEAIAKAYKARFHQDAVMRSTTPVAVSFI